MNRTLHQSIWQRRTQSTVLLFNDSKSEEISVYVWGEGALRYSSSVLVLVVLLVSAFGSVRS